MAKQTIDTGELPQVRLQTQKLNLARRSLGVVFALLSLSGIVVSLIALLDPAGSQMANDAAPISEPPSIYMGLTILLGSCILGALAIKYLASVKT